MPKIITEDMIEQAAILNKFLSESYDREIFLKKSTLVFDHVVDLAITGYNWVI